MDNDLAAEVERLRERVEFWEATAKLADKTRDDLHEAWSALNNSHVIKLREVIDAANAAEGRADGLHRALCETVKASGGISREGLSDVFLILGVPAEMAARKKAQESAEATASGLRRALEEIGQECDNPSEVKIFEPESGETHVICAIEADVLRGKLLTALAASPADHDRKLKAEALRSTAAELEVLRDYIQTEVGPDDARDDIRRVCWNRAKDLREEADRLEAENGTR